MPFERLNGIDLNYRIEGDAERTIVLVNGLADDLESWGLQVPAMLDAGYRVLRFDNRGIGRSGCPPGPYTTAQMAADAKALVDRLGLRKVHMLGVSMGGMIAQEYALAYPETLASVVLACTYAAPGPFCGRMFSLWADMARAMGVPAVMRDVTLWAFTQAFFEAGGQPLADVEAGMAALAMPLDAYMAQLHSIQVHDTTARLGGLIVPTLVLAGEEDLLIPVPLSRTLCDLIPGAGWATSAGGHAAIWEHPEPFNAAVLRHFAKH